MLDKSNVLQNASGANNNEVVDIIFITAIHYNANDSFMSHAILTLFPQIKFTKKFSTNNDKVVKIFVR